MTQRAAPLLVRICREKPDSASSQVPRNRAENKCQEGRKVTYQVKLLLQLFISIIDAKLFKAVHIKGFKTEIQFKES